MRSKINSNEVSFRNSLANRISATIFAVFFVMVIPSFFATGMVQVQPAEATESWLLLGLAEIMTLAIGIPIYYLSGPNDLFINLDRRTYRLVHGWPHSPQVKTGSLDEIAGIFVSCLRINADYVVGIVWKDDWKIGRKWYVLLGRFSRSGKADRLAQKATAALNLPLVEPPACFKKTNSMSNGIS